MDLDVMEFTRGESRADTFDQSQCKQAFTGTRVGAEPTAESCSVLCKKAGTLWMESP
jgi:hypothetical protein